MRLRHIVLIHGASHGGACWEYLSPLLETMGYTVTAPDLPGLGDDRTPVKDVTLQSYTDRVAQAVNAAGAPVLLLGHSMGGTVVCGAAEAVSERIGKLVILAGGLHQDGESMDSMRQHLATFDDPSANASIRPSKVEGAIEFATEQVAALFYNTCPPEMIARATARLRPQAMAPFATPLHLTAARYGALPKTYIVCSQDHAFPVGAQHWFCERMPDVKKRVMNTDHSPFYSDPEGLAAILDEEARF